MKDQAAEREGKLEILERRVEILEIGAAEREIKPETPERKGAKQEEEKGWMDCPF